MQIGDYVMCFLIYMELSCQQPVSSQTAVSGGSDREKRPEGMGKCKKYLLSLTKKAVSRPISGSLLTVLFKCTYYSVTSIEG